MTAYVIVTPHPYFAKVDSQGDYILEDVPPGKYTIVSWHEYFGTKEQPIIVKENQPVEANFIVSECERGEASALKNYRAALNTELPTEIKSILKKQCAVIRVNLPESPCHG